jgi:hypothetical protein
MKTLLVLAVPLAMALAGCKDEGSSSPADGASGSGGAGGGGSGGAAAGGSGGSSGSGGGGGAGTGGASADAGAKDASSGGAPADTRVDVASTADVARPGTDAAADTRPADAPPAGQVCARGGLCPTLAAQYADAVLRAQSCTAGAAGACEKKVRGGLGCDSCEVWVNDTAALGPIRAQWDQAGCDRCFLGSPTGDRCHPIVCPDLFTGICKAGVSGGTCTVNQPPKECPQGTAPNVPCPLVGWFCATQTQPSRNCYCLSGAEMRWTCF